MKREVPFICLWLACGFGLALAAASCGCQQLTERPEVESYPRQLAVLAWGEA